MHYRLVCKQLPAGQYNKCLRMWRLPVFQKGFYLSLCSQKIQLTMQAIYIIEIYSVFLLINNVTKLISQLYIAKTRSQLMRQ